MWLFPSAFASNASTVFNTEWERVKGKREWAGEVKGEREEQRERDAKARENGKKKAK